jgi:plasmid stabilization system protein ParE
VTKIELTLDAERDLIDIYLYGIEHFGHPQAERYAETRATQVALAKSVNYAFHLYAFSRMNRWAA